MDFFIVVYSTYNNTCARIVSTYEISRIQNLVNSHRRNLSTIIIPDSKFVSGEIYVKMKRNSRRGEIIGFPNNRYRKKDRPKSRNNVWVYVPSERISNYSLFSKIIHPSIVNLIRCRHVQYVCTSSSENEKLLLKICNKMFLVHVRTYLVYLPTKKRRRCRRYLAGLTR